MVMAEGEANRKQSLPTVENEPQSFIDDLEKAKALSLETLELDRIRREQRASQFMQYKKDERIPLFTASHKSKSDSSSNVIKATVAVSSSKSRPRPGLKVSTSLDQKLPPPPRRQSAGNVQAVDDLMVFAPAETQKKSSVEELESSIGLLVDSTTDWVSTSKVTSSNVLETSCLSPPQYNELFSSTLQCQNNSDVYKFSFPPLNYVQSLTSLNSTSFSSTVLTSNVPSSNSMSTLVRPPNYYPTNFTTISSHSAASMSQTTNSTLVTGYSNTSISAFPSTTTTFPQQPFQIFSPQTLALTGPVPYGTSPTTLPSPIFTDSSSVLKFIEKKRNSNLIDLAENDDQVDSREMHKSEFCTLSSGAIANDLLKAFDPLLEKDEPRSVPSKNPQNVPDSSETRDSKPSEQSEEPYGTLWKETEDSNRAGSSKNTFEDNFVGDDDEQVNDGGESPPPLPPRPKTMPKQEKIDGSTIVLRDKAARTQQMLRRSRQSRNYESIKVVQKENSPSTELESFCSMVSSLRQEFLHHDRHTNVGIVISSTIESLREESTSVKLVISSAYSERPILFTCDVTTTVEHVISHMVCTLFDDSSVKCEDYVLKVHGLVEYLSSDSALIDYEYVHHCQKFDEDVHLNLLKLSELKHPLARTLQDDNNDMDIPVQKLIPMGNSSPISQHSLSILLETFESEVEKLREQVLQNSTANVQSKGVIQAVKAICAILSQVETNDIIEALEGVIQVCQQFQTSKMDLNGGFSASEEEIFKDTSSYTVIDLVRRLPNTPTVRMEVLQVALERLNQAIRDLLDMYCKTYQVEFQIFAKSGETTEKITVKEISSFYDTLLVHVGAVHRYPVQWSSAYEDFLIVCELYHGTQSLGKIETKPTKPTLSLYEQILFDEWLEFPSISMNSLPRESRVVFNLFGLKTVASDSKSTESDQIERTALSWGMAQLFDFGSMLTQGSCLCGMWPEDVDKLLGPAVSNTNPYCPIMQVSFPEFGCHIVFPSIIERSSSHQQKFESLDSYTQKKLLNIIERSSIQRDTEEERYLLWDKRYYLFDIPQALPRILLSVPSWDWSSLSDIYTMLYQWKSMNPIDAMEILLLSFPDIKVRRTAVNWIKNLGSDELCDYLPQLVQALKYEPWCDCAIAKFLLERSLTSIRVAHHLYWLLKQNLDDPRCGQRISIILNSMLAIAGKAMRLQFESQEELMQNLSYVAEKIKTTKDSLRTTTLLHEMETVHYALHDSPTNLPLSPSLEVVGVDVKSSSYFTSNTLPLKINFKRPESDAKPFEAIFKVGDDLRQDMLTLQMIRIMDKLWLKEGLDLKIVTFGCIATGNRKGVVEMVSSSETLRKIQTEHGLTGSFKDRPIAEWLQKHNPSELEYQQAVENFTCSCAGYSVATYVLGICDRHNDNIMLKTSGHVFHIDFGKFLGDSQMFGTIKRDRAPFVLTSDMAYVINGGDKPTSKFQEFVELCCHAYNIVRKYGNVFLNLFSLMASSGIPGVTSDGVAYIERALFLDVSDTEAAANFARMIEDSLKSWFTQFNFFIHNIAQLRFSGDQVDGALLSFVPKCYTMETDGQIKRVHVTGYQKRYEPEKYYVYILKLEREHQPDPSTLFRSYREFWEFHQKLCNMFPLAKYHSLPRGFHIGRSNIRQVAEKRKAEIEYFLQSVWKMADEIKHCDLVYTFLHPLLRDQQDGVSHLQKVKENREKRPHHNGLIQGEVKLSIRYYQNTLFIMVMHARNLNSSKATGPDSYVKTYLIPDSSKCTKRKTKVMRRNCHPTFMEMLQYRFTLEIVKLKTLRVSVWDYDRMVENTYLGECMVDLCKLDLTKETVQWYSLENMMR